MRIVRRDGSVRHVVAKAECELSSAGELERVFGVFQDVTDGFAGVNRLERNRWDYQAFADASSDGFWDWHIQDDYEYMSPRFWDMFGYAPEEKEHKPSAWQDMIFADDLELALENFDRHVSTKGQFPYEQEVRYRHKDGSTVTVLCRGRVVEWDKDGQAKRMIGTHTDISKLKRAETELKHAAEFQQLLLNVNPDMIFVKDKDFRIVEANSAFRALYPARMQDKIIGYTTIEDYDDEQAEQFLQQDRIAFDEGFSEVVEVIDFPDGRQRTLLTKKVRFENAEGVSFILGVARDITEIKAVERDLIRANKELEEFAYRASHDLRSPLVSSIKLLQLVQKNIREERYDNVGQYVGLVGDSLQKLESLVTDILALTKMTHTEAKLLMIDVSELVGNALSKFTHMDGFDSIEFDYSYAYTGVLRLNLQSFSLVVENLLSNAIKYMDESKQANCISIRTRRDGRYFVFEVVDNGVGIPERFHDSIFKMFKRFHPGRSFGSGLGLYMVKRCVESMQGSISYSSAEGGGSIFSVRLPLQSNDAEEK